jgi:poly(hydroxyalkanoate) granule-associated protein
MPKKSRPAGDEAPAAAPPRPDTTKDSAQQIWLAGLGAFAKAQAEGGKAFEALVSEGLSIQRQTQTAAEDRLAEAAHRVSHLASGFTARATGPWDKLENIFEDRVAKALHRLGVPAARYLEALQARVEALEQQLLESAPARRPAAARPAPRKSATRKTPPPTRS